MQTIKHLILAAVLVATPGTAFAGAYHDLAREPHGIEVPVPEPAPAPAAPAAKKITIYTAKTIVTEDPGTPTAEAVAVMDGKILVSARLTRSRTGSPTSRSRSTSVSKTR